MYCATGASRQLQAGVRALLYHHLLQNVLVFATPAGLAAFQEYYFHLAANDPARFLPGLDLITCPTVTTSATASDGAGTSSGSITGRWLVNGAVLTQPYSTASTALFGCVDAEQMMQGVLDWRLRSKLVSHLMTWLLHLCRRL